MRGMRTSHFTRLGLILAWQTAMVTCLVVFDSGESSSGILNFVVVAALLLPFVGYMVAVYDAPVFAKWPRPIKAGVVPLCSIVLTLGGFAILLTAGRQLRVVCEKWTSAPERSLTAEVLERRPANAFRLETVLPEGQCNLEVMKVGLSKRAAELEAVIQQSVAEERAWFLDYVKEAEPGEPLAYHPNFGLTREEYLEYLREARNRKIVPTGETIPCIFIRDGKILRLDVGSDTSPLSRIRIDLSDYRLSASVGDIGLPVWRSSDREDIPLGPFEGYSWTFEEGNLEQFDVRIVQLWIYRLRGSGKILWRFQDGEMVNRQVRQNFEILVQHEPAGTQDP